MFAVAARQLWNESALRTLTGLLTLSFASDALQVVGFIHVHVLVSPLHTLRFKYICIVCVANFPAQPNVWVVIIVS